MDTPLPMELQVSPPRPLPRWAPRALASSARVFVGAFLLSIGALVALGGWRIHSLGDGPTRAGMVTRTWNVTSFGRTSTMAEVSWLDDDGTPRTARTRVDPNAEGTWTTEQAIGVYVVRAFGEDEATIAAGVPFRKREGMREILIGVAIAAAGLAISLRAGILEPRRRWLLSRGTIVAGRVITSRRRGREVEYEFDAAGSKVRGAEWLSAGRRKTLGGTPREGDVAYVVFDPEKPVRSAIWGFSRVRNSAWEV